MTLSAEKLRFTSVTEGGGQNTLPAIITCGELVDKYIELDLMILQDVSGSYPPSESIPFVQEIATCVLTAWPNCRIGLSYFSDYPNSPYGSTGDLPYAERYKLAVRTAANVASWTLPALSGNDTFESQLDAIQRGADSTTFGWRSVESFRQRVIVLNTDTYPHENDGTHISKQQCIDACINNNVWPIYVLTDATAASQNAGYDLGYGISGLGDPTSTANLVSQILTGIYRGIVE